MAFNDAQLEQELNDIQIQAIPLQTLQQRVQDTLAKLKFTINSGTDTAVEALLADAMKRSTAYSLSTTLDADSISVQTRMYSSPPISSYTQAKAFLGHFLHCYIGTLHQEIRLISLRLFTVAHTEDDATASAQELTVRINALHQSLREACRVYEKLVPMTYNPLLANQSHRFTDPLVLDPKIPLSSIQMDSQHDSASSTLYTVDSQDQTALVVTDYSLPLANISRAPDLYDELVPRLSSLDKIRVGEISRRTTVALERYIATLHSTFHCDYPYLYTDISQLQNSLVVLGDSYGVLLDPLREATEFVSRSTKLVTSSVDKLIRFFAVVQRKPCDENCGHECIFSGLIVKDIGVGINSPIAILDVDGYERTARLNPRYHDIFDSSDSKKSASPNELQLKYRNTYVKAMEGINRLKAAESEVVKYTTARLTTFTNSIYPAVLSSTDAEKKRQDQCRQVSASPLLLVDYTYKFIAGGANASVGQTSTTSASGTADDISRIFSMTSQERPKHDGADLACNSIDAIFTTPTANTKLSSCLPGRGMPVFTYSLNTEATETRIKLGPSAIPTNTQLFNNKTLIIDEVLYYDMNLVKLSFLDVDDYAKMKQDSFDSLTGDILATVNRHISARVKAHLSYSQSASLPANLLHLHYYMIYGKIIHIRARLLSHYNHMEYVRSRMDSDLSLHSFGYSFETEDKPFSASEYGAIASSIFSKENPVGSGTSRYGTLGFKRDEALNERSSLKANDIVAPDRSRILFAEAVRQVTSVIERAILYAGSTLIKYLSSEAAENNTVSDELGENPLRVDRMIILLFLYEQELTLVECKRQVIDQAIQCYMHSVSYMDNVKWLQYVSSIISLRPSYDMSLLTETNNINCFVGCQALVLRLQQVSRFIMEYLKAIKEDNAQEAQVSGVHKHIERQLVPDNTAIKPPQAPRGSQVMQENMPRSTQSRMHSVGSRPGSSTLFNSQMKQSVTQSRLRATSALAFKSSKYGKEDFQDSSFMSERSSIDGVHRAGGSQRGLLLSGHTDISEDHLPKGADCELTKLHSIVTKDSFIMTFPRYAGFGSPQYSSLAGTTICDIHYNIGKLINILTELDKCGYLLMQKYIFSAQPVTYVPDLCLSATYEAAREELFFVAHSRRTRGALGTLPQYLMKQCRYGLYGVPHVLLNSVKTELQAHECLNLLISKRNLALLTIQTSLSVQGINSCFNELGRRLSKLSMGRGPWTNSCLEDMLPSFINYSVFDGEAPEKGSFDKTKATAKASSANYAPDNCRETEAEYDYSVCLLDFSKREFTSTFDSFQLPNDFDFELCLLDPLSGAAVRLLRDLTPNVFKVDSVLLNAPSTDLLEAALPDAVVSCDSSDEEFVLLQDVKDGSKITEKTDNDLIAKQQVSSRHRPTSALAPEALQKAFHPYAHIPNFISPSTASDLSGALTGFSYCSTIFAITTDRRRDAYLETSRSQLFGLSKQYQQELANTVGLLVEGGPEHTSAKLISTQDSFKENPYLYLDNVVGFLQRMVFVQACGLLFYQAILSELMETVMIPLRNLNISCEIKARRAFMSQQVDISAASAVLLLDNVPESTSFFITQQYGAINDHDTMYRGTIPLGKEPQESVLNKYTVNDCLLSFLILAAEYKYIWSSPMYIQARGSYAELHDKLASGVVTSLLMFERTRCIESILLAHKDRLLTVRKNYFQSERTGPSRGSLTTSDTINSGPSSSRVSMSTLDESHLPFFVRIDLRNAELITMALMVCDYARIHSLRGQLADTLNRLGKKHRQLYLCDSEDILQKKEAATSAAAAAQGNGSTTDLSNYSMASSEHRLLEFVDEFAIINDKQDFRVEIGPNIQRYLPGTALKAKAFSSRASNLRAKRDITDIYDILCISPYLLDPLVHENISLLLFQHQTVKTAQTSSSHSIFPHLTIVPPGSAVRFIASNKAASLSQSLPLLSGLIHLYTSYLQYIDFSLVLQQLSNRLVVSEHENYDEQAFDEQVHSLLLDDSSSGFLRRANGYTGFIVKLALDNNEDAEEMLEEAEGMRERITRIQRDDDSGGDDSESSSSSSFGEQNVPASTSTVAAAITRRGNSAAHGRMQSAKRPKSPTVPANDNCSQPASPSQNMDIMDVLSQVEDKLDLQEDKVSKTQIKQETRDLINRLRLISNQRALDFKIMGPRCRNNMVVYFARTLALIMLSVWRQCDFAHRGDQIGKDLEKYNKGHLTKGPQQHQQVINVVDFNKQLPAQTAPTGHSNEEEYIATSVKMLDHLYMQKVSDLQVIPVTPPDETVDEPLADFSDTSDSETEAYTAFIPELGETILVTSQAFVGVLKVVHTMRDYAFERIMGYALTSLAHAHKMGDAISMESILDTFNNVRRTTGFDLAFVAPTNALINRVLGRLKPSLEEPRVPSILEEQVINERTAAIFLNRKNESSASGAEMLTDKMPVGLESTDNAGSDGRTLGADTMRGTKRVSLDLLEESLTEQRDVCFQDLDQPEMFQSLAGAGLKLNLRGIRTCGENNNMFQKRLLNSNSFFDPRYVRDRFASLAHVSFVSLALLDSMFNGLSTGYTFGPQISCFHGYEPFGNKVVYGTRNTNMSPNPDDGFKNPSALPPISLQCGGTSLAQHLLNMGLPINTSTSCSNRDDASRKASITGYSDSRRASVTLSDESFNDMFGAAQHFPTLDNRTNTAENTVIDSSVIHLHNFLQDIRYKNYAQVHGKREPMHQNRHILLNYSDFFLVSENISPLVLYAGEKTLGINLVDEYSEFCTLSQCAYSVVTKVHADVFDPVSQALASEVLGKSAADPFRTRSVVVGRLQLYKLYCMLGYLDSRVASAIHDGEHRHNSALCQGANIRALDHATFSLLPDYEETALYYHQYPAVEPWLNATRLWSNISCLVEHVYKGLLEEFLDGLERLVESIRMCLPNTSSTDFVLKNRFFKNAAPIYPFVSGLYGLSPADIMMPYLPGDSLRSTRFLHKFFGRNMITIEALSNGVANSGEHQHLVVLTNYSLAQMLDKFKNILFGEIMQQAKLDLSSNLMSALSTRTAVLAMTISNTEAMQTISKTLSSLPAAVSSQTASHLHTLQSKLSSLRVLSTNLVREASLLPVTIKNIVTHIYSDALTMLFHRITAEKEIAADISDDACALARRTVSGERIKALKQLSQRVPSQSKFFLECADKEKEIAFYEEALMFEARLIQKSAVLNSMRRSSLERRISDYGTLFEQEYIRLVGLYNILVDVGKETESNLRLEMAQLTQQLQRLNDDNECLHMELQDRLSVVSKARVKENPGTDVAGINTLTPIATIAEAMALPEQLKVDVERLQINTQKAKQDVEILKAEVYALKKQYTRDVTLSEDRARQLRNDQKILQNRRRSIIDTANTMIRDSEQTTMDAEVAWAKAKQIQKADHWNLVDNLRILRQEARSLERTYAQMKQEVQRVRKEGEKLILGGLTPLNFKNA